MNVEGATKFFLDTLVEIGAPERNIELYKEKFKSMSNEEFAQLGKAILDGEMVLPVFVENMMDEDLDLSTLIKVGEKLGIKFEQKVYLRDPLTGKRTLTPTEHLVLELPVRRPEQHVLKKISLPENNKMVSHLTGQPTGASKGASVSLPEVNVLRDKGHVNALMELIKVKGGDQTAFRSMLDQIESTGSFSLGPIDDLDSTTQATKSLKTLFMAMHLGTT